jgi:predicted ATPase
MREIDNVRIALDWAFSSIGDSTIGVILTAAYVPVWLKHSMLVECRERTARALRSLQPDDGVEAQLRMQLQLALGTSLIVTFGPVDESRLVFSAALDVAKRLEDMDAQLRALWGLWTVCLVNGECQTAEVIAEEFHGTASRNGKLVGLSVAHRILGYSRHLKGAHGDATRHFERVLGFDAAKTRERDEWFLYDQRVLARAMLARALCMQGFLEQAADAAQVSLDEALATGNKLTLCLVLADAVCLVAVMVGKHDRAERGLAMLADTAEKHGFRQYIRRVHCLEGMLLIARSKYAPGVAILEHALEAGEIEGWKNSYPTYLGTLAEGLAGLGQRANARAAIDQALANTDDNGELWYLPELLRIKGDVLLAEGADDQPGQPSEHFLERALAIAREQGALLWELKAATRLARLRHVQSRGMEARELLAPIYARFTEGFQTPDLSAARQLLGQLA